MKNIIALILGGGLGSLLRYVASKNIQLISAQMYPLGTLFVNAAGSYAIGLLFYLFDDCTVSREVRSFILIGFLGAFTTFSTYSLETINLLRDGEIKLGILNMLLNNLLCFIMVILGMITSRMLLKIFK